MSEERLDLVIADLRKQVQELSAEVTALTREVRRTRVTDGHIKNTGTLGALAIPKSRKQARIRAMLRI